ncbi:SMP-30/gluconolactonase/LRE family protein [Glaciihabitans sp. dw_435]|uniref:SMP-30/gluconolactonase/LRE family protein n=1 Tax=Glaciihabitans sp. dw_435 TaxID=2720081 RepID=UPI001BD3C264|nr:SMP-30/gluconolactonase/LRE family protein [Glaciihabitans sp. dw_435]
MTDFEALPASSERHVLAEGPVWLASTETLLWVDIEQGHVLEGRLAGDTVEQIAKHEFGETVGAAARSDDGHLLVAARETMIIVDPTGVRTAGPRIVPAGSRRRTNDGAVDPAGRFLIGTLSLDDVPGGETLVRIEDDTSLTVLDDDLSLSNGLAWSPDGTLLYSIDTVPGIVWVRDYDAATGAVGDRREHVRVTDGHPDGMCADAYGNLWIAIWGAGEVRSYSPTGAILDTVRVAAPHPSSVAFAGPDLDLLIISTASRDLSEAELELYPSAGCLFSARVGATGVPSVAWNAAFIRP